MLTQLASGVLFGVGALALHLPSFFAITIAIFAVIAFSGATHDIAADGVYMSELSTQDQAKYIGWQGAFYNLAKLVATGGLVWFAGWALQPLRPRCRERRGGLPPCVDHRAGDSGRHHGRRRPVAHPRAAAGRRPRIGRTTRCARGSTACGRSSPRSSPSATSGTTSPSSFLYRLGEGFVMKIVPLFLKADTSIGGLGLSNQQIGLYYGSFGAGAFLLGSLLAGYFIAGRGLKRTLFTLCCIFNIPFAVYALLALFQPSSMWLVGGGIVLEYFGYGFGFVGLTLFMMQQVAPGKHQMAHYAFASGIMNLSVMVTGMASGFLSDLLGYKFFFIAVMVRHHSGLPHHVVRSPSPTPTARRFRRAS